MQSLVEAPKVFYEQPSAFHNLKYTRTSIDYTHNSAVNFSAEVTGIPFTASSQNLLLFGRGNRVHYKNLQTSEGIGQLCNLKRGKHSDLYMLSCPASADVNNTVAVSTGHDVHLWDFAAKKEISSWQSKQHTFLAWNGPTLTVGTRTGTIRSYDTRIASKAGVRDRLTKSIRHESTISALAWSDNGRFLASGDVGGTVYVWDIRDGFKTPLEVGDQVQRRKKIQHDASITSIAWCDYSPKIFSTADSKGSLRVWNADVTIPGPTSSIVSPGRLDVGAPIRNVFFSPHIKELLVVKGPAPRLVNQPEAVESNCLTSYAYPSLRHVVTSSHVSEGQDVGNAILLKGGTKAVVSVPTQGKLHIWDVFAKPKSLKRQSSFAGLR
ncbi:WD40 repeat-like protein [Flagelloscypha sp. PMI_526]|nr:WD40 repeat-like protein [Flagelloscypha sp. PMI_526]